MTLSTKLAGRQQVRQSTLLRRGHGQTIRVLDSRPHFAVRAVVRFYTVSIGTLQRILNGLETYPKEAATPQARSRSFPGSHCP